MSNIIVENLDTTELALIRSGETIHRRSLNVVRGRAEDIAALARELAPKKDGFLEDSIGVLDEERGDRNRVEVIIGVDSNKLGPGYTKYGERYDWKIENGEFVNLGEGSLAKAQATGQPVGPQFLERASLHYEKQLEEELEFLAESIL